MPEIQCVVTDEVLPGNGDVTEENLEKIENEMQAHINCRRFFMYDTRNYVKSKRVSSEIL